MNWILVVLMIQTGQAAFSPAVFFEAACKRAAIKTMQASQTAYGEKAVAFCVPTREAKE